MSINYLDNIKVGDKIELPKKEKRPQEYLSQLRKSIAHIAQENNQLLGFDYFDKDLRIKTKDDNDLSFIEERENEWSAIAKKDKDDWLRDKEKNTANITEMATTLLLNKYLKDIYIVARASTFDDYKNGEDNVLIHRESGDIVCGVDEVIGHQGDDGGKIKEKKVKKIMAKGGSEIKYGARLDENRKIVPAVCKNIPAFYLSMSKKDLLRLLEAYYSNNEEILQELFNNLLSSIKKQLEEFKTMDLDPRLMNNLNKFKL
jgi:hypothetical protein